MILPARDATAAASDVGVMSGMAFKRLRKFSEKVFYLLISHIKSSPRIGIWN